MQGVDARAFRGDEDFSWRIVRCAVRSGRPGVRLWSHAAPSLAEPIVSDGCSGDDECPQREACVNRECRDPCNCGANADCDVVDHRPICRCKAGYDGNPLVGCVLCEYC